MLSKDQGPFVTGDTVSCADFFISAFLMYLKNIWGEDSEEWKDVTSWNDGRWKKFAYTLLGIRQLTKHKGRRIRDRIALVTIMLPFTNETKKKESQLYLERRELAIDNLPFSTILNGKPETNVIASRTSHMTDLRKSFSTRSRCSFPLLSYNRM